VDHRGGAAGAVIAMSDTTHRDLWVGIDLKIQHADFHFDGMNKALQSPKRPPYTVAALIGRNWHTAFYAHLDAFLSRVCNIARRIIADGVDDGTKGELILATQRYAKSRYGDLEQGLREL
jgi:hypothetical protein